MSKHRFDDTTPVFDFGANQVKTRYEAGSRVRFVWPVYACEVICELRRDNPINMFQEYVLRLLHDHPAPRDQIATTFCLEPSIIAKILDELKSLGWLGRHNELTERASEYLTKEEDTEYISGTIFVDATLKDYFVHPILVSRNINAYQVKAVSAQNGTVFKIVGGTAGKPEELDLKIPKRIKAFHPQLDEGAILAALKHGVRITQRFISDDQNCAPFDLGSDLIRSVTLLPSEPRPYYIATCAFVPETKFHWVVCDLFGRGPSLTYRGYAQKSSVIKEICEMSLRNSQQSVSKINILSVQQDALDALVCRLMKESLTSRQSVEDRLSQHPELTDRLGAWWEACLANDRSQQIGRAWACLEQLFADTTLDSSSQEKDAILSMLPQSPLSSGPIISGLATRMGFYCNDDVSSWLYMLTRARIKGVLIDGNTTLNAALSAAILCSIEDENSRWYQLALVRPDLLKELLYFNNLRNQMLHEGQTVRDSSDTEPLTSLVLDCLLILIFEKLPCRQEESSSKPLQQEFERLSLQRNARLNAIAMIEEFHIPNVGDRLHVENLLAELFLPLYTLEAQDMASSASAAEVILKCYRLAEYCARRLCEYAPRRTQPRISVNRDNNALSLNEHHTTCGGKGSVDIFGRANPRMLETQLRQPRPRGLSACVWKLLIDARDDDNHPLNPILKQDPCFVSALAQIANARGHGDRAHASSIEAIELAQQTQELLSITLKSIHQDYAHL